jgi:hypothetical protein
MKSTNLEKSSTFLDKKRSDNDLWPSELERRDEYFYIEVQSTQIVDYVIITH